MCGIAGYFGTKEISDNVVEHTIELMKRRGPDSQHVKVIPVAQKKKCYLLHSRLSIIDLDKRADQPFSYKDKTIIFNGEIYNYVELKDDLLKLGHQFITESDTEVLIHALDEWGIDAYSKFEGMWSFALFNHTDNTLTLSRDRFGEKPLYIYRAESGAIYFGSEIKFLRSLSQCTFTPNKNHITRFLVNGYKSLYKSKDTFFEEISEIEAGSHVTYSLDNQISRVKYWHPKYEENNDITFEEAVAVAREKLIRTIECRLRSDVPIAFHMSGGVDSNTLISIAKRVFDYDVHGFTIQNTDSRYEEQDMVDLSVNYLGIKHTSLPTTASNFLENMRELVNYHDAPVLTITYYLNWLLQKEISNQGYKISISGTAADELFSGYFDHQIMYFYDIRNDEALLEQSIQNWKRDVAPIVRNPLLQSYKSFIDNPFQRSHAYLNNDVYASYLNDYWSEPFYEKFYRKDLLRNRMLNEIFHETTPLILHEEDLNAMYYSVENRSPFLDRSLFEFCQSIPTRYLIQDGKAKAVLRESMRGIVADQILDNSRKVGFNAPIFDLLDVEDKEVTDWLVSDSPIFDVVSKSAINKLVLQENLKNSDSKFLFSFLSAKIFMEQF